MKSKFLSALQDKEKGLFPVWIMRQAGRYLPAYQNLKKKHSLKELFKNPKLAAKTMLLPFETLSLDAAILFSDITLVLEALGCEVDFLEGKGPWVTRPDKLKLLPHAFCYTQEILQISRSFLQVPTIGFCGGPFTVLCYFLNDRYPYRKLRAFLQEEPRTALLYLEMITEASFAFIKAQEKEGIAAFQIFESHFDLLASKELEVFCFPFLQKLCEKVNIPLILYVPGGENHLEKIASFPIDALGITHKADVKKIRKILPPSISLQGNFDVSKLFLPKEEFFPEVEKMLQDFEEEPGYIVNLSEGIWPNVPFSKVQSFVECVHNYAKRRSTLSGTF